MKIKKDLLGEIITFVSDIEIEREYEWMCDPLNPQKEYYYKETKKLRKKLDRLYDK